jgi:uncharacterized protein (DUF1697 family)
VPAYVALLRAVNVGGRTVPMASVRSVGEGAGYSNVRTFLQSGNLLFEAPAQRTAGVERRLEAETRSGIGVSTDYIVRTAAEWRAAIDENPFPNEARDAPAFLHVVFLKGPAADGADARLREAIRGREDARVRGRAAYVVYPDGAGRSKLTLRVIERAVGQRGTARNWNTVSRIAALLPR